MLIDTSNYQFWIAGLLWFTVPIMSWFWSLASIRHYHNFNTLMQETKKSLSDTEVNLRNLNELSASTYENLNQIKKLYEQASEDKLESKKLKALAEEELKTASDYYTKIKDLLANSITKTDTNETN